MKKQLFSLAAITILLIMTIPTTSAESIEYDATIYLTDAQQAELYEYLIYLNHQFDITPSEQLPALYIQACEDLGERGVLTEEQVALGTRLFDIAPAQANTLCWVIGYTSETRTFNPLITLSSFMHLSGKYIKTLGYVPFLLKSFYPFIFALHFIFGSIPTLLCNFFNDYLRLVPFIILHDWPYFIINKTEGTFPYLHMKLEALYEELWENVIWDLIYDTPQIRPYIGHTICLGVEDIPSVGYLKTSGFLGNRNWSGNLYGNLIRGPGNAFSIDIFYGQDGPDFYPAVYGFTGFSFHKARFDGGKTYFGVALRAKVREVHE